MRRSRKFKSRKRRTGGRTMRRQAPVLSSDRKYPGPLVLQPTSITTIQLRSVFSASSDGSGIFKGVIPADPSATLSSYFGSVTMFSEWTTWTNLFNQVKCVQLEVKILPTTSDEVKGDAQPGVVIGSNLISIAVPSIYGSVSDNPDSQIWTPLNDNSGKGRYHSMHHFRRLGWANTNDPSPKDLAGVPLYIGCPGGIAIYGSGFAVSTQIFLFQAVGTYLLSNRT